jgi:hypothetical protein
VTPHGELLGMTGIPGLPFLPERATSSNPSLLDFLFLNVMIVNMWQAGLWINIK